MFDKNKFAQIIKNIKETYLSQEDFSKKSSIGRTYLSQYMNMKLNEPPKPIILQKLAASSNGLISYEELMEICGYFKGTPSNNTAHIAQRIFDENIPLLDKYNLSAEQIMKLQEILIERNEKISSVESQINSFVEVTTIEGFEKDLSIKDLYNELISINNRIAAILDRYNQADYEYPIPLYDNISVKNYFIDFKNSDFNKYINLNINLQKMNELIFYFALVASDNSMAPLLDIGDIAFIRELSKKSIDESDFGGTFLLQVNDGPPIIRKLVHTYGEPGLELQALNMWNFPAQKNIQYNEINLLGEVIRSENRSAYKKK